MMNNKKKILLVGPMPLPYGGVSIHLNRLSIILRKEFNFTFIDESRLIKANYFNLRSLRLLQYIKLIKNSDLIFIHSVPSSLRIFHLIISKLCLKKMILTIHSYPEKKNIFIRYLHSSFYSIANKIIVVSPEINDRLQLPERKITILNAFIPPIMNNEKELPHSLKEWFIQKKNENRTIICGNAFRLDYFNNVDLYGLDLCIDCAYELIKKKYSVCFIFNVASLEINREQFLAYQMKITSKGLDEYFLLLNKNLSFVKVIEQSDVVVRPTLTDGDALTIREALFLGKPVIASDIVRRPLGTLLFKTRDLQDFKNAIIKLVNSDAQSNPNIENISMIHYTEKYKDLINSALNP